jgi:hypothetical protein
MPVCNQLPNYADMCVQGAALYPHAIALLVRCSRTPPPTAAALCAMTQQQVAGSGGLPLP